MRALPAGLRRAGRRLLARGLPAPRPRHRVAVVGLPRSGTSWLGKALSLGPGISYYFEPDVLLPADPLYRYLPAGADDRELERALAAHLDGRAVDEYVIAEQGLRELLTRPGAGTVLVKWVRLGLMLEWIRARFPGLALVQIIRHPVPLFLSWRQRAWDPGFNLQQLLSQPALMSGPLAPFADAMGRAEGFWEQAAAFWGAMTWMQYRAHRAPWLLVEHEWICLDAEPRIRLLADRLGLPVGDGLPRFLSPRRDQASGPGYGPPRDPAAEVHKWRDAVSAAELAAVAGVLEAFDLPFYPGLAPDRFEAPGSLSAQETQASRTRTSSNIRA